LHRGGAGLVSGPERRCDGRLRHAEEWSDELQLGAGRQQNQSEDDPLVLVRTELFDGGLITSVFHEWDGSWQYLTPDGYERDKTDLVHQSHVLAADPSLRKLAEMPPGVWAGRSHPGDHWQFEVLEAEEDD
jgi:hypothetical protein